MPPDVLRAGPRQEPALSEEQIVGEHSTDERQVPAGGPEQSGVFESDGRRPWPRNLRPPCPFATAAADCELAPSGLLFWRCSCHDARLDLPALTEALELRVKLDLEHFEKRTGGMLRPADAEGERATVAAFRRLLAKGASGRDVAELIDALARLTPWQRERFWLERMADAAADAVLRRVTV